MSVANYFYDPNGDTLTFSIPNQIDIYSLSVFNIGFSSISCVFSGKFTIATVVPNIMVQATDVHGEYAQLSVTIYAMDGTP